MWAVGLVAVVALVLCAPMVNAASAIVYGEVGPLKLCMNCGAVTGEVDSIARNFNTAMTAGVVDTSLTYAMPSDIVWGAVSDSLPLMVRMERVPDGDGTMTGGAADSLEVDLQLNYGGTVFPYALTSGTDGYAFSMVALVGTGTGGIALFKPGTAATVAFGAINTYTIPARSYAATQFRVRCRSTSVAAAAGRYRLYLRYPKLAR